MGSVLPFAFSVHHFINSVGADAGFAAIIGLAILILLYFAHARETASLREQIYEWAQRVQQLEARVTQLSRQQASLPTPQAPVPARTIAGDTRAVPAAAAAAASAAAPRHAAAPAASSGHAPTLAGAPAGVAAPALTAATKLIPTYADVAPEPAAAGGGGPGPVAAGQLPPDATGFVAPQPQPQPATVAGGANGSSYDHDPTPPPSFPQGQPRGAAGTMPPAPPRMQLRQATPPPGRRGTTPPRNGPQRPQQRTRGRRGLALILVALIAVAVVAVVFVLTSGGGSSHKQTNAGTTSSTVSATRHRTAKGTAALKPSSVTVAVLNGTVTQGLAQKVSQKLTGEGYKPGRYTTAADQTRTSTEVAYMPGHQRDALLVARSLNLGRASVQAVDQSTQSLACPPALGACTATVVVTLGTDLANTQ